jgi:xanthine dehydrogenase accessory factor
MRELAQQLIADLAAGRPLVYCRLVETRGSTPQKAGAAMLVYADGAQAGTLGGGCVEAEVKRQALAVLQRGEPQVLAFQLDSDYGWDDGLICGGRMLVLVEPLARPDVADYYRTLAQSIAAGEGCAECVVFDAGKSGLAAPASYLFDAAGNLAAHCRGRLEAGQPPARVREVLAPLESRPQPAAAHGVAFLPSLPRCRLVIVGAGHVGQAVAHLAADLDFDVWVLDDREQYCNRERFPRAERLIVGSIGPTLQELEITPHTYALIVTRGHSHDELALYHLAERGARYVGLIGSQRKIKLIFDDLLAEGISPEALAQVHAPLGIDIGSQTVPEIAVSIAAELVAHRNRGGMVPGRPARVLVGRAVAGGKDH